MLSSKSSLTKIGQCSFNAKIIASLGLESIFFSTKLGETIFIVEKKISSSHLLIVTFLNSSPSLAKHLLTNHELRVFGYQ